MFGGVGWVLKRGIALLPQGLVGCAAGLSCFDTTSHQVIGPRGKDGSSRECTGVSRRVRAV